MRIDGGNSYNNTNAAAFGFNLSRLRNEEKINAAITTGGGTVTVKISAEAREAYEAYAVGQKKKETGLSAKDEFAQYLKKLKEGPATKQERLDKLKAELKQLQSDLQETAADEKMAPEIKEPKVEALNTQIQHKMQAIADLTTDMSRDTEPESALL